MKSYTDIEQSKKLAEILPIESADMWFCPYHDVEYWYDVPNIGNADIKYNQLPCWSLTALLSVLPEGIIENYYAPYLQKENGKYSIAYGNDELLCIADNPIDACYEMILKLNKINLL